MPDEVIRCVKEYKLIVYDRWGEKLFTSIEAAEGWDGTYKGETMNTQVVAYYLRVLFTDGTGVIQKGNVSLIR